ncbi:MAG: hypothetical protein K5694_05895, partial [Bacilli bacterium]|nr:hypothetical protein [Bacilli bacterium]
MNIINLILASSSPFTAEDFLNKLFPNLWSVLINLIALIVLFLVVYFVAYKRIKKYKDARKDYIERNIRDAEQAKRLHEGKAKEADAVIE